MAQISEFSQNPELLHESPLSEAERHRVLVEWNATQATYPQESCIHQLFEAQVRRTPDAIAVVSNQEYLTYHQLDQRAEQLARHLQRQGVGPDILVGLYVERSLQMLVGVFAILKAGGAYVPLDPAYPPERLAFMLEDAQPRIIVTQQHLQSYLPTQQAHIICLDAFDTDLDIDSDLPTEHQVGPDNTVYVIYTSGSTGAPKGILIRHQALVNYAYYAQQRYGLQAGERVLQFASLNFDASAEEIYPCLISGATLVLRTDTMLNSVATFFQSCTTWGITVLDLPTAYWHEMTMYLADNPVAFPSAVRVVIIGGERALPERLATWQQHVGSHVALFNTYGPTETTIVVTVAELQTMAVLVGKELPIGRPIANIQLYLLDGSLQPVPIGTAGELYIGGVGLARGYLRRPGLTAERFIEHPFSSEPGARLYKSGDIARYLPNGEIEFLGRADQQVKIRGFRVELEEIETVLRQHAGVRDAVLLAREDTPGEKQLVAYVIQRSEQACNTHDLRLFLRERLPYYMIPTAFVLLEAFPLTPNGKIDKRALPMPTGGREQLSEDFVAPTQLLHQQLITIWEDLLHIHPIGIRDNFFYLGGHSLLAARMVAQVEQLCGKRLALTTLFTGPTIELLAEALQQEEGPRSRTPIVVVQRGDMQRPFFFLHGDPTGGAFYCFPLARYLGPEQAFYALEPYRFIDLPALPSLPEMARAHITAIRAIQPQGPYALGGWCDGGLMAYEIAYQLHAEGQKVEPLVLMDPGLASPAGQLFHDGIRMLAHLFPLSNDQQLLWYLRIQHLYDSLRLIRYRRVEAKRRQKQMDKTLPTQVERRQKPVFSARMAMFPPVHVLRENYRDLFNWIAADYTLADYPDKITILWAEKERQRGLWWRKAQQEPNITLHFVPGTHMTCRVDHLPVLAERLRAALSLSHSQASPSPSSAVRSY